jgi:hypothetical protein
MWFIVPMLCGYIRGGHVEAFETLWARYCAALDVESFGNSKWAARLTSRPRVIKVAVKYNQVAMITGPIERHWSVHQSTGYAQHLLLAIYALGRADLLAVVLDAQPPLRDKLARLVQNIHRNPRPSQQLVSVTADHFDHRLMDVFGGATLSLLQNIGSQTLYDRWTISVLVPSNSLCLADIQWLHARAFLNRTMVAIIIFGGNYHAPLRRSQFQFMFTPKRWFTQSPLTDLLWQLGYYDYTRMDNASSTNIILAYDPDVRAWLTAHPFPGSDRLLGLMCTH